MNRFFLLIFFSILFVQTFDAQQKETADIVYLKDGTMAVGKIITYIPDSIVAIQSGVGNVYTFTCSQIEKILLDNKTIVMKATVPQVISQPHAESLQTKINKAVRTQTKQPKPPPITLKQSIKSLTPSLAEIYLERLASKNEQLRITEGAIYVGLGTTSFLAARSVIRDVSDVKGAEVLRGVLYGLSAAMGGIGIWQIIVPSDIEDEYSAVVSIADSGERNSMAREKMQLLSEKNYGTTFSLVWWGLWSIYYVFERPIKIYESTEVGWSVKTIEKDSPYNNVIGGLLGMLAITKILISREDVIEQYNEAHLSGHDVGLNLELMVDNGIGLRLQYNFK